MKPKEVFLSHSSKDRVKASMIAETLRNHGVSVWYSSSNIRNAQQWIDEIGIALKRCDWFLLLLSKAAVASDWVKRELSYAVTHKTYYDHILPVKLQQCKAEDLLWFLPSIQMVSFTNQSHKGYRDILSTWGIGFDPGKKANYALKRTRRLHRAPKR